MTLMILPFLRIQAVSSTDVDHKRWKTFYQFLSWFLVQLVDLEILNFVMEHMVLKDPTNTVDLTSNLA